MDMKIEGLPSDVLRKALNPLDARHHILDIMEDAIEPAEICQVMRLRNS